MITSRNPAARAVVFVAETARRNDVGRSVARARAAARVCSSVTEPKAVHGHEAAP